MSTEQRPPWWREYSVPENQAFVERQIAALGPYIQVTTPHGSWMVPRHYIALHGLKSMDLPGLAQLYGWEKVEP